MFSADLMLRGDKMNLKTIIKLMDLRTLVAGFIPVLLGTIYSYYAFGQINLVYFILLTIAMALVQSSTNMINDYFDFKRGAENENKGDEKALVSGEATPKQVKLIITIYLSTAAMIGVLIASQTSYYILVVAFIICVWSVTYCLYTNRRNCVWFYHGNWNNHNGYLH
jgi:1,4-dihydroxy-2-naphthoate octaprenyltransferase